MVSYMPTEVCNTPTDKWAWFILINKTVKYGMELEKEIMSHSQVFLYGYRYMKNSKEKAWWTPVSI